MSGLQAPYTDGIFDETNSANPFQNWSKIYIPYCTGDAHIGTNPNGNVPNDFGVATTQHFVGHLNMQLFVSRIVPTFKTVGQVVLLGSSAGGIGAGLNFGMVQDAFGSVPVTLVDDSFPPFTGTGSSRRACRSCPMTSGASLPGCHRTVQSAGTRTVGSPTSSTTGCTSIHTPTSGWCRASTTRSSGSS